MNESASEVKETSEHKAFLSNEKKSQITLFKRKEALSLRKQNQEGAALPRKRKGQRSVPGAHSVQGEPAPNPQFKTPLRLYSKLAFMQMHLLARQKYTHIEAATAIPAALFLVTD